MPNTRLKWFLIGSSLGLILILALTLAVLLWLQGGAGAQIPPTGPTVQITSPGTGELMAPAPALNIQAIAQGDNPIQRIELWLDGEVAQTVINQDLEDPAPISVNFGQPLSAGGHLLFVRAVDTRGLIGQSYALTAEGTIEVSGNGPFSLINLPSGDSLDEVLADNGLEPGQVVPYNPGLADGSLGAGSVIAVPVTPDNAAPEINPPAKPGQSLVIDHIDLLPEGNPTLPLIPDLISGPPTGPVNLQISRSDCSLDLTWQDTSQEEAGYQIWVTGLGVGPRVAARTKATPGTGPVSVTIPALGSGDFVYWVEAYNAAGSQPSNQASVSLPDSCQDQLGGFLTLEAVDFSAPSQYERAYCYVSLLDNPEVRLPSRQDQFIALSGGTGDLTNIGLDSRSYKLPVPGNSLGVKGECWAWAGGSLSKLGTFNQTIDQPSWDGTRLPLSGSGFEIGIKLTLIPSSGGLVPFSAPDPGIPSPQILSVTAAINLGDVGLDPFEALDYLDRGNLRTITWEWFPDPNEKEGLTGFTILVNGVPFQEIADPQARNFDFRVPGFCGTQTQISLVANIGDRRSLPSNSVADTQPSCTVYAAVDFKSLQLAWVNDSLNPNNHCDTVDTYFQISVSESFEGSQGDPVQGLNIIKSFNGGGFYQQARCGTYDLNYLAGPAYTAQEIDPTLIIVPLRSIEGQSTTYKIEATVWDYDTGSGDDVIARFQGSFWVMPGMVNSLLAEMTGSPKKLANWYCDDYTATYDGDAKSMIDVCVDLYADNPSTGGAALPSNTSPAPAPTSEPGLQFKPLSDLQVADIYIDPSGELKVRVRNEGPDDLANTKLEITTTIQSSDPKIGGTPWITRKTGFLLKNGARRDIPIWPWDKLDPSQYSYSVTVSIAGEGYTDPDPSNNTATNSWSGSGLQTYPEALYADLMISSIQAGVSGDLEVTLKNNGPDLIDAVNSVVTCQASQISRADGSSTDIQGLEKTAQLRLDAQSSQIVHLVPQQGEINLLTSWYFVSCQVKPEGGFSDPNEVNNFLTQPVY